MVEKFETVETIFVYDVDTHLIKDGLSILLIMYTFFGGLYCS